MSQSFSQTIALIKSDMRFRCQYESKSLGPVQFVKLMLNPACLSTILYRYQIFFYRHDLTAIAYVLQLVNSLLFTVQIDSRTQIGEGLFIMHSNYICIGPRVQIGKRCMIAHQNSIVPSPFYENGERESAAGPTLGDDVMLGGGACITGAIIIGNKVKISMNAAVDSSFEDNAVLFGVPAKNMVKPVPEAATNTVLAGTSDLAAA